VTASGQVRRPVAGLVAASASVVVWGISSVLIKEVEGVNGLAISFHRLWIGALLTGAVFVLTGGRYSRRLLRLSLAGGLAFGLDIVLFFSAVQETSVANATVIGALQPVLVLAIARRLFGEQPRLTDAFWAAVAIGGAAVVVFGGTAGGAVSRGGDLLAVAALFAWTWYFVASKRVRVELSSFEYLAGLSVVAAVVVTPVALLSGTRLAVPEASGWATIVAIAVINGALGHFLMNWAHGHIPIVVTSLLTLAIPVFAAAAAAVLVDEPVTAAQVVGMAVVIASLAVVVLRTSRSVPEVTDVSGTPAVEATDP
jgi:drug/metabolite transporter (DMT)-like permease